MFKLRKEHLDAFEAQAVRFFTSRVIAHLEAVWPAECAELGAPVVAEMAKKLIARAVALGFSMETDIVRFVDLAFILAEDFEINPNAGWIRPVLADRKFPPTVRMDRLYQRMEEEFVNIEKRKRGMP